MDTKRDEKMESPTESRLGGEVGQSRARVSVGTLRGQRASSGNKQGFIERRRQHPTASMGAIIHQLCH